MEDILNVKLEIFSSDYETTIKKIDSFHGWSIFDFNDKFDDTATEPAYHLVYNGKNKNYAITIGKSTLIQMLSQVAARGQSEQPKPNIAYGSDEGCCGDTCTCRA